MNEKVRKIILSIVGIAAAILLFIFGPALFDRIIGVADRSTKGSFKNDRYTYKLNEKSDILPFSITLLPDTDLDQKRVHAIVGFHYYPIMDQEPTENRYYEFTDDGSLTVSNNLLLTLTLDSDEKDYYPYGESSSNISLFASDEEESEFYYMSNKDKQLKPLSSTTGFSKPAVINNAIYWAETKTLDDDHDLSSLVRYDINNSTKTKLTTRPGMIDLLDSDSLNLIYIWADYEDDKNIEYLYPYNLSDNQVDSISTAKYDIYIVEAFWDNNTVYFPLQYHEYEDEPVLGSISFDPGEKPRSYTIPAYKQADFSYCKVGGG